MPWRSSWLSALKGMLAETFCLAEQRQVVAIGHLAESANLPGDPRSDVNGHFAIGGLRAAGDYAVACEWGGTPARATLPGAEPVELVGEVPALNAPGSSRRDRR